MRTLCKRFEVGAYALLVDTILWFSTAAAMSTDDLPKMAAKVTRLAGEARYYSKGWHALEVGTQLTLGSTIQTSSSNSIVVLQSVDSNTNGSVTICVFSNSILAIEKLGPKMVGSISTNEVDLRLTAGRTLVVLNEDSNYDLRLSGGSTPLKALVHRNGVQGLPIVCAFGFPGTLTVLKGAVTVSTGGAKEQLVAVGEQLHCDTGQVTQTPANAPEKQLWP